MNKKQYLLLAAVVATVVLSAGEARASLLNEPATCEALGAERACVGVPSDAGILDTLWTVADTGPGGDPLFTISATETTIVLTFTEFVTENTLNTTGFKLSGLQSVPDLIPGELDVTFLGDFTDLPSSRPFVTEDLSMIQWSLLTGADPSTGAVARINLDFVSAVLDGDYDDSGTVGAGDLSLVLGNWGLMAPPTPDGWINQEPMGTIGAAQLSVVLSEWGNMAAPPAVPEPVGVPVWLCGFAALAARRRFRTV